MTDHSFIASINQPTSTWHLVSPLLSTGDIVIKMRDKVPLWKRQDKSVNDRMKYLWSPIRTRSDRELSSKRGEPPPGNAVSEEEKSFIAGGD